MLAQICTQSQLFSSQCVLCSSNHANNMPNRMLLAGSTGGRQSRCVIYRQADAKISRTLQCSPGICCMAQVKSAVVSVLTQQQHCSTQVECAQCEDCILVAPRIRQRTHNVWPHKASHAACHQDSSVSSILASLHALSGSKALSCSPHVMAGHC